MNRIFQIGVVFVSLALAIGIAVMVLSFNASSADEFGLPIEPTRDGAPVDPELRVENNKQLLGAQIIDLKPQHGGDGFVAFLRHHDHLPKIVWLSNALSIERIVEVEAGKPALAVTPAITSNDLLLVGEDGRVCVEVSIRHPYGEDSYRIRWQVSCYDNDGTLLWTANSPDKGRDIAGGIGWLHGNVTLIKDGELIEFGSDGSVIQNYNVGRPGGINSETFVFGEHVLKFLDHMTSNGEPGFRMLDLVGNVVWSVHLPAIDGSSAKVQQDEDGNFVFGLTDFGSYRKPIRPVTAYAGKISTSGELIWLVSISSENRDVLVDVTPSDDGVRALIKQRSHVQLVSLSASGEVTTTREAREAEPEGILALSNGEIIVYGATEKKGLVSLEVRPWIERLPPQAN